ncbi:MAG: chemotaxis protein [Thaumarchaeota archaeon]|nr:chemotaxis protein [Nitrososphaerota archaeon]MDE1876252.1 chemotaxis protein [Nitrososphaerota archaeon]
MARAKRAESKPKDSTHDVVKKMSSISDATKTLASEVKTMSKIFAENQKILISLKDMISSVNSALDQIQKNSRQINIIEEDTQRLFSGMTQVKAHSNLIDKINSQINKLQDHVEKIRDKQESMPDTNKIMQSIADNLDSTRNNTKMIMHVSEKTEKVREEIKNAMTSSESLSNITNEIEELRKNTNDISTKTQSLFNIHQEIEEVKQSTKEIASKTGKMSELETSISNLKGEIGTISTKTDSISGLSSQIRNVGSEIDSLIKKTESLSSFGNDIRNINSEFVNFRENMINKSKDLDEKISDFAELLNKNSASILEFNKKTYEIAQQLEDVRSVTHKTSQNTSHEVMGLLRLSEFQSNIRMRSESKYGTLEDIEKMAGQTRDMVNLFDKISIEVGSKMPLPSEVKQWSISKILDCADKWEIRFTDVFRLLITELGSDIVKEAIRIEQVRDLFGIRAVDEIRRELNIN